MKKCQKAEINYIEMEKVINRYWISRKDLSIILPQLTYASASREFNIILDEMEKNDEFYFHTRPSLIPIRKVIEKFNIDVNFIRREANKIKKYKEGDNQNAKNQVEEYN